MNGTDHCTRCAETLADVERELRDEAATATAHVLADLLGLVPDERLARAYAIVGELPEHLQDALLADAATRTALARAEADALGAEGRP